MRFSLLPREESFFNLFAESAGNVNESAKKLLDLMEDYTSVPEKVAEIKRLEEVGDAIIHRTWVSLRKTFFTPIDREDIANLGERLDDVVDNIEEAARYMLEYRIQVPTENAKELSRIILRCSAVLVSAMAVLKNRKGKLADLLPLKDQLHALENEADQVTSKAMGELFENYAAIEIIKWKEVYAQLEGASDRCEEIAVILEGLVIKHG
jgi:predicted phosphate transport protein (TIGR00153 family)